MIPPKTVQDILEAVRIEEVIEEFIPLRKRGVNLLGLCPFHGEKSPSFNVNPVRNIFKCFGCGKAGDAVTFLREHENYSFEEAIRWLGKKYNIEIKEVQRTPEQVAEMQLTDSLYIINEFAQKHFQEQLFDTDEGNSVALSYFKKRGLREETIRAFGLGYAPDIRDLLLRRGKTEGYSLDLMQQVGIISPDKSRDFFRARVMFSIHSLSGKIAAFAGRTMSADKTIPKYVNSPETPIYVKNKMLYGIFQAKNAIRKNDACILVEGYMDVISLYQAGIQNVVASSGTSLTEGQLQLIKRNTQNLYILYDGDPAGIKAAVRGLDLALEQDLNVRITLLPDGHDPDSFVQENGPERMLEFMESNSKDFIVFKTGLLLEEAKGDPIKRAGLVRDIMASVAKIPDAIKRGEYIKECSALLQVPEQTLLDEIKKLITGTLRKKADKEARAGHAASDSPDRRSDPMWPGEEPVFVDHDPNALSVEKPMVRGLEFQERDLIRLLVQFGTTPTKEGDNVAQFILADIDDAIADFDNPLYGQVAAWCRDRLVAQLPIDQHAFLQHEQLNVRELAIDLLTSPFEYSPNWEAMQGMPLQNQPNPELNFDNDMRQAVTHFKLRRLMKMCDLNQHRIKLAHEAGQIDEMIRLMRVQQKLQEARNEMAKLTNSVILK